MTDFETHEHLILRFSSNRDVSKSAVLEAIDWLIAYGAIDCIFSIASLSLDLDTEIRERAWGAIEHYLAIVPSHALPNIEVRMRNKLVIAYGVKIEETKIPVRVLGLLSFSFDGYVRERALKKLAARYYEDELPFIVLRLNDWVEKIHDIADGAIQERLHLAYGEHWIKHAALFYKLWNTRRYQFRNLREVIEKHLKQSLHVKRALHSLCSPDTFSRRYLFNQCLDGATTESDLELVVEEGLVSNDVVIRVGAVEAALERFSTERIGRLLPSLLKNSCASIRMEALAWVTSNKWSDWENVLLASLFDRNGGVRQFARYHLPNVDAKDLYVSNLQEKKFSIEVSLFALLELKATPPSQLIRPFLSDSNSRNRAAAYALLLSMADTLTAKDLVLNALIDGSAKCERVVWGFLYKHWEVFSADEYLNLLSSCSTSKRKRLTLETISRIDKWDSLPLFLLAACEEDEARDRAEREISKWLNRYHSSFFSRPSDTQLDRLNSAFEHAQNALSASNNQRLDAVLRSLNSK